MNKLTIPALLLGVVMVAGAFAFMPVQEASTVHTTGTAQGSSSVARTMTITAGDDITLTCGSLSACVIEEIYVTDNNSGTVVLTDATLVINSDSLIIRTSTIASISQDDSGAFIAGSLTDDDHNSLVIPAGLVLTVANSGTSTDITVTVISSGAITIDQT